MTSSPALQDLDPRDWRIHRYGLPIDRWERLRPRSYWITGAGTGFGQAMAVALASAGAEVFLTGRREAKLQETIENIRSVGAGTTRCHSIPADLTVPIEIEKAGAAIQASCASLQGVVNNAAASQHMRHPHPLQQERADYWDDIMHLNVRAPWLVTKTILPHMVRGSEVKVLFITSGAGWAFAPGYGHYNISKAALNSLTACFAGECHARYPELDIQINALDPGQARTEMNPEAIEAPSASAPWL